MIDNADKTAKALREAAECYKMDDKWAFLEALMFNSGNYKTPKGRLEIKDACFDSIVRTQIPNADPHDVLVTRNNARKTTTR